MITVIGCCQCYEKAKGIEQSAFRQSLMAQTTFSTLILAVVAFDSLNLAIAHSLVRANFDKSDDLHPSGDANNSGSCFLFNHIYSVSL